MCVCVCVSVCVSWCLLEACSGVDPEAVIIGARLARRHRGARLNMDAVLDVAADLARELGSAHVKINVPCKHFPSGACKLGDSCPDQDNGASYEIAPNDAARPLLHQEIVQQLLAMVEAALGPEPRVLFYCFAILGIAPCV